MGFNSCRGTIIDLSPLEKKWSWTHILLFFNINISHDDKYGGDSIISYKMFNIIWKKMKYWISKYLSPHPLSGSNLLSYKAKTKKSYVPKSHFSISKSLSSHSFKF